MKGENGFGYDAMFIADGEDRTMAEMTHEEKNEISHRGPRPARVCPRAEGVLQC